MLDSDSLKYCKCRTSPQMSLRFQMCVCVCVTTHTLFVLLAHFNVPTKLSKGL